MVEDLYQEMYTQAIQGFSQRVFQTAVKEIEEQVDEEMRQNLDQPLTFSIKHNLREEIPELDNNHYEEMAGYAAELHINQILDGKRIIIDSEGIDVSMNPQAINTEPLEMMKDIRSYLATEYGDELDKELRNKAAKVMYQPKSIEDPTLGTRFLNPEQDRSYQ